MKVIEFKLNDKLILCESVKEITTAEFLKKQKEVVKNWEERDEQVIALNNEIAVLKRICGEQEEKIKDLYLQIAIDRGEVVIEEPTPNKEDE